MLSRRKFLQQSAQLGTCLTLSASSIYSPDLLTTPLQRDFKPNIYLRISPQNQVDFWVKKAEMGQQIHTTLAQIAMDELGADLSQVNVISAQPNDKFKSIFTGASWSVAGLWKPLRQLMAEARYLLIQAACQIWQTNPHDCVAQFGSVIHQPSRRQLAFGKLVAVAASMPLPSKSISLKPMAEYQYIGKNIGRLDNRDIVRGQAQFCGDMDLPDIAVATIVHAPLATCQVGQLNTRAAEKIKGVRQIINLKDRVAVVADNNWTAMQAMSKLKIDWHYSAGAQLDSDSLLRRLDQALELPGTATRSQGDTMFNRSEPILTAEYYMPFASHMPMEPPVAIAQVESSRIEVWAPTQIASELQRAISELQGLNKARITINTTIIGGSFGRKLEKDFVIDAVKIAAHYGKPIKLQWTRESDVRNGFFRPYGKIKVQASTLHGRPHKMIIKSASPSLFSKTDPGQIKNGHDWAAVMGLTGIPYSIENMHLTHQVVDLPEVSIVAWRGTFSNHNCFAVESLIDELAHLSRMDPLAYRLQLLTRDTQVPHFPGEKIYISHQRLKRVLKKAAAMLGWQQKSSASVGHGIACFCYDTNSYAAHAIEVGVNDANQLTINRVMCAFDIGVAINPDAIKAQLEGSIIFGLSSALYNEITFNNGQVIQSNFHDQPTLTIAQTPKIDIEIFADGDTPGGVGECGLPSVTPALCNAIFDACGKRLRHLPIKL